MRRHALGFLGANALCVGLAALAGAVAHSIGARLAPDLYSIAIGDTLLPPSPVDSWFWGPILIGMFVSWWFGFIAAPLVYVASLLGPRRSFKRPLAWFVLVALVAWAAGSYVSLARNPDVKADPPNDLLVGLIDWGYLILALAFAALALSRWRGREKGAVSPPKSAYPRPSA